MKLKLTNHNDFNYNETAGNSQRPNHTVFENSNGPINSFRTQTDQSCSLIAIITTT